MIIKRRLSLIILLIFCSCNDNNDFSVLSNLKLFEKILIENSSTLGLSSVQTDKEIVFDSSKSIFIVQLKSNSVNIYSFWVLEKEENKAEIWAFAGVYWGEVNNYYNELKSKDSLPILLKKDEWWLDESSWDNIEKSKLHSTIRKKILTR